MIKYTCDICWGSMTEPYAEIKSKSETIHLCSQCHLLINRVIMYPKDFFDNYNLLAHMDKLKGGPKYQENETFNSKEREDYDTEKL